MLALQKCPRYWLPLPNVVSRYNIFSAAKGLLEYLWLDVSEPDDPAYHKHMRRMIKEANAAKTPRKWDLCYGVTCRNRGQCIAVRDFINGSIVDDWKLSHSGLWNIIAIVFDYITPQVVFQFTVLNQ